jgi:hypothetical protein
MHRAVAADRDDLLVVACFTLRYFKGFQRT